MTDQYDDAEQFFANLPRMSRRLRWVLVVLPYLFAFTVLIGLVGGLGLQRQAADIQASTDADRRTLAITRETAFEQCQLVNDNARALNGLIDKVILRVRVSSLPTADKDQAVALYESSKQALPVCEAP